MAAGSSAVTQSGRERASGIASPGASDAGRTGKNALLDDPVLRAAVLEQLSSPLEPLEPLEPALAKHFGRELVHGEWRLIQRFDRDGRRFFVWQRNEAQKVTSRALTERERVVLARVARGMGDRAVSLELGCSTSTVATHRLRAMAKLGIASRTLLAQVLSGVLITED
jgi:DNA-binding NarL/FixJ family response regulator